MAIVVVHMNVCKKTHKITVKQKDDGDFSLHVASDCPGMTTRRVPTGNGWHI